MFDHPLDSDSYLILGISSIWEVEKRAEIHMNKNKRTIMNALSKIHLAKLPVNAKYQLNDVFSSTNEGVILIHSVLPKN